jgi:hypothetical protein
LAKVGTQHEALFIKKSAPEVTAREENGAGAQGGTRALALDRAEGDNPISPTDLALKEADDLWRSESR